MNKLCIYCPHIIIRHKAQQEEQRRKVGSAWIKKDFMLLPTLKETILASEACYI